MLSNSDVLELVYRFSKLMESRKGQLVCFRKYGVQIEGWLKGELLTFLDSEKQEGRLHDFDREASFDQGRRKIDINLTNEAGERTWIELKHWLIGNQKGYEYGPKFYFGDKSSVGIKLDVEKLQLADGRKHLLILTTSNPGADSWFDGVRLFNDKFNPLHVSALTDPRDFPGYYFLGVLST